MTSLGNLPLPTRRRGRLVASALAAALGLTLSAGVLTPADAAPASQTTAVARKQDPRPLVIAHRGASGYRPEHTLAGYQLAIQMGADYVEPDLVSTKDHVLVARHENEIGGTTNVADHPEFAARKTTKTIDGKPVTGWFTEDFTLAELKTLRAKERLPLVRPGNTRYDGRFEVPTFEEVLTLVEQQSRITGRRIGVYPETKHPTYFQGIGLPLEKPLVAALKKHGLDRANAKVFVQSFETTNLRQLSRLTKAPLIQLVDATGAPYDLVAKGDPRTYADLVTAGGLKDIATYADGIGPNKDLVLPRNASGATGTPSRVVPLAHARGLVVHVFTLRDENQFMAQNFRTGTDPNAKGNIRAEVQAFLDAGVDGMFGDYPDSLVDARADWLGESPKRSAA